MRCHFCTSYSVSVLPREYFVEICLPFSGSSSFSVGENYHVVKGINFIISFLLDIR